MIKVILFDFAGVIGTEGYWLWLKENVPDLENKKFYFESLSQKIDRAEITDEEFINGVAKGANVSSKIIKKEVFEKIIINKELLAFITQLRKKYRIGLLTNYHLDWIKELLANNDLDKYFDGEIISAIYKTIKPDREIFQIALDLFKVNSSEVIFIDDRQKNVDGAKKLGIKSFLFTTNSKLAEDLKIIYNK